jgi:hypothetical protein
MAEIRSINFINSETSQNKYFHTLQTVDQIRTTYNTKPVDKELNKI